MRCPKCGKAHTRVVDSRMQESNNTIKRRRECCSCNYRFTTFERCEDPIEVIKSDGTKQRFDRNKLLVGLMRATIKRDIDTKKLNEIIDDIEVELRSRTLDQTAFEGLQDAVLVGAQIQAGIGGMGVFGKLDGGIETLYVEGNVGHGITLACRALAETHRRL